VALGGRLLYVPVSGLGELAHAVREATRPFNRSPDRDEPFLGHLTLARVRRGRRIPRTAVGIPLSSPWPVREFRLVSSTTGADGAQYMPVAHVTLKG
jgi:2'-5' RNA ligase